MSDAIFIENEYYKQNRWFKQKKFKLRKKLLIKHLVMSYSEKTILRLFRAKTNIDKKVKNIKLF